MYGASADSLAGLTVVLPLVYVATAVLRRPALTWPVLAGCFALFFGLEAVGTVPAAPVLLGLGAAALVAGAVGHREHDDRRGDLAELGVQAVGLALFGGLALVATGVAPDAARYVVAAAWLGHAAWDVAHHRAGHPVSRTYAEWCAVLDTLVAASLLAAS